MKCAFGFGGFRIWLLIFLVFCGTGTQASDAENLMEKLWTQDQLQGKAEELKILKDFNKTSLPDRPQKERELPRLDASSLGSIRRVQIDSDQKVVALTFDLCETGQERSGYDFKIVDTLRQEKVPATFFAGGQWMQSHQERSLQLMADPLFELGNHAWTHGNLRVLKGKAMEEEISRTQEEYDYLQEVLGERMKTQGVAAPEGYAQAPMGLFRFPYGACSDESLEAVNRRGLKAIQWDVVSGDAAKHQTQKNIVEAVQKAIKPGSIVVFHANGRGHGTSEALPVLIQSLRHSGYQFVKVSELLKFGRPISAPTCYENRPGDNLRYDRYFRVKRP